MKKIILALAACVFTALSFSSCYDAIFQSIRDEVELEDGTISGNINNIVRFNATGDMDYTYTDGSGAKVTKHFTGVEKQFLFLSNGKLYYKDALLSSHGEWNRVSGNGLPETVEYSYFDMKFSGKHIFKVAADSKYMYVITYEPYYDTSVGRNIPKDLHLYYCEPVLNTKGMLDFSANGGWQPVKDVNDYIKKYLDMLYYKYYRMDASVQLFCTNATNPEHRKAYIRVGGDGAYNSYSRTESAKANKYFWQVYALDGGTAEVIQGGMYTKTSDDGEEYEDFDAHKDDDSAVMTNGVLGAVYFSGEYLFTDRLNALTDETYHIEYDWEGTADGGTPSTATPVDAKYVFFGYDGEYLNYFSDMGSDTFAADTVVLWHDNTSDSGYKTLGSAVNKVKADFAGCYLLSSSTSTEGKTTYSTASIHTGTYTEGTETKRYRPDEITRQDVDSSTTICSMAITSDYLILGTGGNRSKGYGAFYIALTDGKPAEGYSTAFSKDGKFPKGESTGASAICEPYIVRALISQDPSLPVEENDIYLTMDYIYTESTAGTSISNRGLWSYYPSRGNWNRE